MKPRSFQKKKNSEVFHGVGSHPGHSASAQMDFGDDFEERMDDEDWVEPRGFWGGFPLAFFLKPMQFLFLNYY